MHIRATTDTNERIRAFLSRKFTQYPDLQDGGPILRISRAKHSPPRPTS